MRRAPSRAPRSPPNGAPQIVQELAKASDAAGGLIAVRKESAGRTSFFRFLSRAAAEAADAAINADTKAAALAAVVAVSDKQGASTGSKAAGKAGLRKRRATASIDDDVAVVDSAAVSALREKVAQDVVAAAAAASAVSTSSRGLSDVAQVRERYNDDARLTSRRR